MSATHPAAVSPSLSRGLRHVFLAGDPGLLLLGAALRVTGSALLTGLAVALISRVVGLGLVASGLALLMSVIPTILIREPYRAEAARRVIGAFACAAAAAVLTWSLLRWHAAADACFLALIVATVWWQGRSARAPAFGISSFLASYLVIYVHPDAPRFGQMLALMPVALVAVLAMNLWLWPLRPARVLRHAAATAAACTARALRAGRRGARGQGALQRALLGVNRAALAIEDQLALLAVPPRHAGRRDALRREVLALEVALGDLARLEAGAPAGPDAPARLAAIDAIARRLDHAADAVADAATGLAPRSRVARPLAWRDFDWRGAARVGLSAGLSMALGALISPERWYWAAITAYVVFTGVRSQGDFLFRAGQRMLGTVAGVAAAVLLLWLMRDAPGLQLVALLAAVFGWSYFLMTAYARGVFFITIMVGIIYGQLGVDMQSLFALRVVEVLVGVLGALAAISLIPSPRTGEHVSSRRAQLLRTLAGVLDEMAAHLRAGTPAATASLRRLDRGYHDMLASLQPRRAWAWLRRAPARHAAIGAELAACAGCLHQLRGIAAWLDGGAPADAGAAAERLALAARHADALAAGTPPAAPAPTAPLAASAGLDARVAALEAALRTLAARSPAARPGTAAAPAAPPAATVARQGSAVAPTSWSAAR